MAEEDKKRYEIEMANYVPHAALGPNAFALQQQQQQMDDLTAGGKKRRRRKRKMKDPNAPKRCMSAFFWFSQDERTKVRAANPDFGVGDTAKELGRRWSEASATARAKYEALAEQDRARYDVDKRAYQQKLRDEANGVAEAASAAAAAAAAAAVEEDIEESEEELLEEELDGEESD